MPSHDGRNLTYSVVHSLGRAIVSGAYAAGLPVEGELAKQYGVSRTLIREAVKMITAKGLVGSRPRQGIYVEAEQSWDFLDPDVLRWMLERGMNHALLREFAQLRLAVEPKAAAQAAQMAGEGQKASIRAALARIVASERGEDDGLVARIEFHGAVLRASGNRFYARIGAVTEASLRLGARLPLNLAPQVPNYTSVCGAILVSDSTAAEAAMHTLIQATLDRIDDAEARAKAEQTDRSRTRPRTIDELRRAAR